MKKGSKPKVTSNVVSTKPFPPVNAPDPINAKVGSIGNLRRVRDYSKKGEVIMNDRRDKDEPQPQAESAMPRPTTMGEALQLMRGDYTHGHPGLPPKDYKPPRESRR